MKGMKVEYWASCCILKVIFGWSKIFGLYQRIFLSVVCLNWIRILVPRLSYCYSALHIGQKFFTTPANIDQCWLVPTCQCLSFNLLLEVACIFFFISLLVACLLLFHFGWIYPPPKPPPYVLKVAPILSGLSSDTCTITSSCRSFRKVQHQILSLNWDLFLIFFCRGSNFVTLDSLRPCSNVSRYF